MTIGKTIRAIRRRLDLNMVEFGQRIGVRQSTVSLYESGKITPSQMVLIKLLPLAEGEEKGGVADALVAIIGQPIDLPTLEDGCNRLIEYAEAARKAGYKESEITAETARQVAIEEAARLVKEEDLLRQPLLAQHLRYWRKYGHLPGALQTFREVSAYMEVQLTLLLQKSPEAKKDDEGK